MGRAPWRHTVLLMSEYRRHSVATSRLIVTALAVGALVALSGCTASSTAVTAAPLKLSIGTDDSPGVPSADEISHFSHELQTVSGGTIVATPRWDADGDSASSWDQAIAQMVVDGKLDMALVPARTWDSLNVTSLEPLVTPFLIQSDDVVAKVIASPDLTAPLLSGLPAAGVTGLSLFPESLRHPFGFAAPLLVPADYRGGQIRTPAASVGTALFGAYGARATDDEIDTLTQVGMESSYMLENNGTATGNVTFFPKVNVLVINSKAFAHLTKDQRAAVAKAAAATQTWAIANIPTDRAAAAAYCADGRKIVGATQAELTALEKAAQPVVDQFTRNGGNAAVIAAIRSVVATAAPADPTVACP